MQVIELRQYGTLGRNQHHNYFSHTVMFYHLHQGLDSYILQRCIRNWCMCMSPTRSKCSDIMLSVNCELHGKWSWTTMIKFIYSIVCWCTACNCWYIKCHDRDDISALNITCYLFFCSSWSAEERRLQPVTGLMVRGSHHLCQVGWHHCSVFLTSNR